MPTWTLKNWDLPARVALPRKCLSHRLDITLKPNLNLHPHRNIHNTILNKAKWVHKAHKVHKAHPEPSWLQHRAKDLLLMDPLPFLLIPTAWSPL